MGTAIRDSSAGSRTHSADRRIEVSCPAPAVEAVAEILRELGAPGVAIEGLTWDIDGDDVRALPAATGPARVFSVIPEDGAEALRETVEEACTRRIAPYFGSCSVSLTEVSLDDWIETYRRSVQPTLVAPGLTVAPPWADVPEGRVLRIEPGAAFGTGDHASTRTTLRAGLRVLAAGDDVIDLGCGTGILGAAALLFGAAALRAYDLDAMAVAAARDTLRRNGLQGAVSQGPLPEHVRPADLLFANLSGTVLLPLLPALRLGVRPGGHVVLGGVLREDQTLSLACAAAGLTAVLREEEGEWQAICCQRTEE